MPALYSLRLRLLASRQRDFKRQGKDTGHMETLEVPPRAISSVPTAWDTTSRRGHHPIPRDTSPAKVADMPRDRELKVQRKGVRG